MLGLSNAASYVPYILFSLHIGALLDTLPQRKILYLVHILSGALALTIGILAQTGKMTLWSALAFSFMSGSLSVIYIPLRQLHISSVVDERQVLNAVALYATTYNLARMIGPSLAGLIIEVQGVGISFFSTAAFFFVMPAILPLIHSSSQTLNISEKTFKSISRDAADGVRYGMSQNRIRDIIVIIALIGIFAINFSVMLPVLATDVLQSGSLGYGLLTSTVGLGTFLGALFTASRSRKGASHFMVYGAPVSLSFILISIGCVQYSNLIILLLLSLGFLYIGCTAAATASLQLYSDPKYRGRVMSMYSLVLAGTSPIGNILSGFLIEKMNVNIAHIVCGILMVLLYGIYFLLFIRKGGKRKKHV